MFLFRDVDGLIANEFVKIASGQDSDMEDEGSGSEKS